MNKSARHLRPLAAVLLFLSVLLPLRADSWLSYDVFLSAGRSGHDFRLEANPPTNESVVNLGLVSPDPQTMYGAMRTRLSVILDWGQSMSSGI